MSPDRYSDDEPPTAHHCRDGWLTPPDDDHPRRCPVCRPTPAPADYGTTNISARARAAIEKADQQ